MFFPYIEDALLKPEDQELLRRLMDSGTGAVSNLHRLKAASTAEVVDELDDDLLHGGVAKYHSWSTLVVLDLSEGASCTCQKNDA